MSGCERKRDRSGGIYKLETGDNKVMLFRDIIRINKEERSGRGWLENINYEANKSINRLHHTDLRAYTSNGSS